MFPRHSALVLLLLLPQLSPAADAFGRVELSLNQWQETMDRLTRAEAAKNLLPAKPPAAPCDAIISIANCEIAWSTGQIRLTTDFEIEILNQQWITLPLADATLPLISSQVSEGRIILKDYAYALLTNKTGKVKIRLVQEGTQISGNLNFWLAPAISTQARLTTVDPASHCTLNTLPLTAQPSAVAITDAIKNPMRFERTSSAAQNSDPAPGIWHSRSETQIAYEDGRLNYRNRIVLVCTSGNDQEAMLILPADCMLLDAEGEDLTKWDLSNEPQNSNLRLRWKKSGSRQRVVQLHYAIAQPNIVGKWRLISPQPSTPTGVSEVWQLVLPVGLQTAIPEEQPLAASLSNWMQTLLVKSESAVFQTTSGSTVDVHILKTIALAAAQIEAAKFSSELATGGGMLTDARLEITASQKTTVDLQFDPGSRIISCRVAGQKQNPVDLGEGRIQLDIPAPGSERVAVDLTFSQQLPTFDPASGQVRLSMPLTSLLTKAASWSIRLPAGFSLTAFDGTVLADSAGANGELRFHQELYRDSSPLAVLFYQKQIK